MSTATFLYIGLDNERRQTNNQDWPCLSNLNGFLGLVEKCDDMAKIIDNWLVGQDCSDFPGVFDYECTEALGAWLYHHIDATPQAFLAELVRFVAVWTFKFPVGIDE